MKAQFFAVSGIAWLFFTFECGATVVDPLPSWSLDFHGEYALTPQTGNRYGNWTRSGDIIVDTSEGLRLEVENGSSGSFTIVVPSPVLLGMIFETAVEGKGLMTFYGNPSEPPYELSGDFVTSSGSFVRTGSIYGFKLDSGPNSRTIVNVLDFHVIPEPQTLMIVSLGGLFFILRACANRYRSLIDSDP